MNSNALQLTMNTKLSLILIALSTFVSCDKFCENGDGDLFWIKDPVVKYTVTDPEVSPMGTFKQKLWVDDHNYTLQIKVPVKWGKNDIRIYYKEGFKSGDEINVDKTQMLDLIRIYGFKDLDLLRVFGYQKRKTKLGKNKKENISCYHYECDDAALTIVNCNLTANTPSCKNGAPITPNPNTFIPVDKKNIVFLDQCQIKMTRVRGNIFDKWLVSAFGKKLPKITVLEDAVKLDWKTDATKFPEGKITKSRYNCLAKYVQS